MKRSTLYVQYTYMTNIDVVLHTYNCCLIITSDWHFSSSFVSVKAFFSTRNFVMYCLVIGDQRGLFTSSGCCKLTYRTCHFRRPRDRILTVTYCGQWLGSFFLMDPC